MTTVNDSDRSILGDCANELAKDLTKQAHGAGVFVVACAEGGAGVGTGAVRDGYRIARKALILPVSFSHSGE